MANILSGQGADQSLIYSLCLQSEAISLISKNTLTTYNVPVRLVPSLVVQCTVFDKNNYRVKAINLCLQCSKPNQEKDIQCNSNHMPAA